MSAGHPWMMRGVIGGSVVAGLLESAILVLVAQAASIMVEGGTRISTNVGALHVDWALGIALAVAGACALARLALCVVLAAMLARLSSDLEVGLRARLFAGYDGADWAVKADGHDGDVQELLSSHIVQASQGLVNAGTLVSSVFAFAALVVSALFLSPWVALLLIGATWLLSLVLRPLTRRGRRHGHELSVAQLAYAEGVGQAVRLAEETQVFGTSAVQRHHIDGLIDRVREASFKNVFVARLVQNLYQSLATIMIIGGLTGLYWSGAGEVAILGAVVLMLVRSASYAQIAHTAYVLVQQANPFLERVVAAETRYRNAARPPGERSLDEIRALRCQSVGYRYGRGADGLADVDFEVVAGQSVGIVGQSGAGKSTLVQILIRLRTPADGEYLVNGRPASEYLADDWHGHVAYVPQDPQLVTGTVRDNIRFLRDMDDRAIQAAARMAHIHDDILSWPDGYATRIEQRGEAVSGGQRQRICLARALAGDPTVLILDEPTSALDLRSESLIWSSLESLHGQLTLFVVSHRLSRLSTCDRVLVLEHGRMTAFGPPEALGLDSGPAIFDPLMSRRQA